MWMVSACEQNVSNFTLWQLPLTSDYVGNSYVFLMENGKVAVMDGGLKRRNSIFKGISRSPWAMKWKHGSSVIRTTIT